MAIAIDNMSSFVPSPFMLFTAHRIILQFDFIYPNFGSILSIVGKKLRKFLLDLSVVNSILVSSHLPVHRFCAHSSSRSNGIDLLLALLLADLIRLRHG